MNSQEQIVGFSDDCSGNNQHAFLWEGGRMIDLSGVVPASSGLTLIQADFINESGEIAAEGMLPNGDQRAVLLIPCHDDRAEGCNDASDSAEIAKQDQLMTVTPHRSRIARPYRGFGRWPRK
jgi:probable HAF family extracellular repeat protein